MKKLIFSIIVLLFAVIISILFLILTAEKNPFITNGNKNSDSNNLNEDSVDVKEAQNEINAQDSASSANQDSSGGGDGGSGGGASSDTSTSNSTSIAYCSQISYALRNFIKNSECLSSSNGICTNKNVHCSVTVENLDQSAGQFIIEISLYNSQSQAIIQQFQISKTVSQSQQVIFDKSLSFQSQLEDGDANKEYDCSFKTLEVPKKIDC